MPKTDITDALKKYGIFFGVVFGMAAILLSLTILGHGSWKRGLTQAAQDTLNYYYPDSYTVTEFREIDSMLSTNAALFTLRSKKATSTELSSYGILLRIPTIAGAMPAFFLYSERYGATFVGYALTEGKAEDVLRREVNRSAIAYWEKRIPAIIEKAEKK